MKTPVLLQLFFFKRNQKFIYALCSQTNLAICCVLMVLLLVSVNSNAEALSKVNMDGHFVTSVPCHISMVVTAQNASSGSQPKSLKVIVNKNIMKTFYSEKKSKKFYVWTIAKQVKMSEGEHHCQGQVSSDWLINGDIKIIAWEEEARDMPGYIQEIKNQLDQAVLLNAVNRTKSCVEEAENLKNVLVKRLDYLLKLKKSSSDDQKQLNTNIQKLTDEITVCQAIIETNSTQEKVHKGTLDKLTVELDAAKSVLKELLQEEDASQGDINAVRKQIVSLEKQVKEQVRIIEKLHEESYECEDIITSNNTKVANYKTQLESKRKNIELTEKEIPQREEDLAQLNKVIDGQKEQPENATTENTTIVYKKESDKWSTGEIFGIACIPALGIGLPVGVGAGIAYKELTRDSESSQQDETEEEDALTKPKPETNEIVIRNLGSNKQEIRK